MHSEPEHAIPRSPYKTPPFISKSKFILPSDSVAALETTGTNLTIIQLAKKAPAHPEPTNAPAARLASVRAREGRVTNARPVLATVAVVEPAGAIPTGAMPTGAIFWMQQGHQVEGGGEGGGGSIVDAGGGEGGRLCHGSRLRWAWRWWRRGRGRGSKGNGWRGADASGHEGSRWTRHVCALVGPR